MATTTKPHPRNVLARLFQAPVKAKAKAEPAKKSQPAGQKRKSK